MIIKRSLTKSIPKTLIAVVYDNLSLSSLTLCDGQVDLEGAENIDDAVTCFGKQNPGENYSKEQQIPHHPRSTDFEEKIELF